MWTLEEGLSVVRELQPLVRAFGYHIAIGGGVVNKGSSPKDLDLYFLAMDAGTTPRNAQDVVELLDATWGEQHPLGFTPVNPNYPPCPTYKGGRFTYTPNGKRIDVFIA